MGSKNRILLGLLLASLVHYRRNFFTHNTIYMTKRVHNKIKIKHPEVVDFIDDFESLQRNVVGSYFYDKQTLNCITCKEERYLLFALKQDKHFIYCNTVYSLNDKTLKVHMKKRGYKKHS